MVDIDKAVIARLRVGNQNFEILVDCDKALEFRHGKDVSLDDVLATDDIFKDVKKGEHAPENEIVKIFNTSDKRKVAERIVREGEVQLTAEYKNKLRDEKRKQIIELIHRNSIDPKTNLPHPAQRIENALDEARVRIDEFKKAEEQVRDIIDKIRGILPIKYETREVAIKLTAEYAGKSYSILKQYGKVIKDEWQNDGGLVVVLEIPAGLQLELIDKLNALTHGDVDFKVLGSKGG